MKSVLISIHPKWCELIASGKKTVEVRKTKPKLETPFKVYIYQTRKPVEVSFYGTGRHISEYDKTKWYNERSGKVIGEFLCDYIYHNISLDCKDSCVSVSKLKKYANGKELYGWHISDLVIYDNPIELSEFSHYKKFDWWDYGHHTNKPQWKLCDLTRPPQSWCYVEEVDNGKKAD
jgi:predicted transcriptional regulator